ncbi:MAG: hypothetical protein WDW36_009593 [Sanguina aurantia]
MIVSDDTKCQAALLVQSPAVPTPNPPATLGQSSSSAASSAQHLPCPHLPSPPHTRTLDTLPHHSSTPSRALCPRRSAAGQGCPRHHVHPSPGHPARTPPPQQFPPGQRPANPRRCSGCRGAGHRQRGPRPPTEHLLHLLISGRHPRGRPPPVRHSSRNGGCCLAPAAAAPAAAAAIGRHFAPAGGRGFPGLCPPGPPPPAAQQRSSNRHSTAAQAQQHAAQSTSLLADQAQLLGLVTAYAELEPDLLAGLQTIEEEGLEGAMGEEEMARLFGIRDKGEADRRRLAEQGRELRERRVACEGRYGAHPQRRGSQCEALHLVQPL